MQIHIHPECCERINSVISQIGLMIFDENNNMRVYFITHNVHADAITE